MGLINISRIPNGTSSVPTPPMGIDTLFNDGGVWYWKDSNGNISAVNGTSGTSGISGTSGTSGLSGTSGTSGIDGTSGTSGLSGTSGTSGTVGTSGTSGTSGISGTSGTSGISGTDGTSGSSGSSGTSGTVGTSGTSGTSGLTGTSGTSGLTGTSGSSGSSGTSGLSGTSGTSGTSGATGATGSLTQTLFEVYIDPAGVTASYLIQDNNWSYNIYGGTALANTLQGQKHYDTKYVYEAVDDNIWVRHSIYPLVLSGEINGASFSGTPSLAYAVTFSATMSWNYAPNVIGEQPRTFYITNKSSTGFTINSNSSTPMTGNVWWTINKI